MVTKRCEQCGRLFSCVEFKGRKRFCTGCRATRTYVQNQRCQLNKRLRLKFAKEAVGV